MGMIRRPPDDNRIGSDFGGFQWGLAAALSIALLGCLEYKASSTVSSDTDVTATTDTSKDETTGSQCSSDVQCLGLGVQACYRAVCRDGQCVGEPDPVQAGNPCNGSTACEVGVCAVDGQCIDIAQTDCSNFDGLCKAGVCDPESGACSAEPLDDQSACQLDICTSGTCQAGTCADLKASEGAPCSTGIPCRSDGVCDDLGTCVETPDPACQCSFDSDCDDGLACTADACQSDGTCSNQVSGSCAINGACFFKDQPAPGNPCLVCDPAASATSWSPKVCQDSDDCTLDTCEWGEGCAFPTDPQEGETCELPSCPGVAGTCQEGSCQVDCPYQCFVSDDCSKVEGLELPNSCHVWSCEQNTCVALPDPTRVDDPCDAGDVCIVGATCTAEGDCVGTPYPCPAPACNIATCQASADNQPECSVALVDAGTACDDGSPCTAMDECDAAGACTGTTLDCSAYDSDCLVGVCDGGLCTTETKGGAGAVQSCDDGNPCTGGDICQDGVCGFSEPCGCATNAECDDGNSCTFDICSAGQCIYEVQSGTCFIEGACYDDGDTLASSLCLVCDAQAAARRWTGRVCDDGESCTDDFCDAATGCVHVPDDDNFCTDGLDCSTDDQCKNGVCEATCECQSDEDCTWVVAGACEKPLCTAAFDCIAVPDPQTEGTECNDGLFCTVGDTCSSDGVCAGGPIDCAGADDTCLIGTCDDAADACVPVPAPDGTLCDDGDACTTGDTCTSAQCSGQPLECEGSEDGCSDATCVDGNCLPVPLTGDLCDDGEDCTVGDACDAGTCKGGWNSSDPQCGCGSDGDCVGLTTGCFEGKCDLSDNSCFQVVVTEPLACDDGISCTFDDTCNAGSCEGTPYTCEDDIACTANTCDGVGGCQYPLTSGQCLIEGACVADGQTHPANPCLICDSALAGQTWSPAPNGAPCDDGDACSSGDGCDGSGSCVGIGYTCPDSDGLPCTIESCDPNSNGCVVSVAPDTCHIGDACYEADETAPNNVCQVCLPSASTTSWSAVSKPCDDGVSCTYGDTCSGFSCVGTWYSCSDGKSCTADICTGDSDCLYLLVPTACLIGDTCYEQGDVNPGNPCETCDAADTPNGWTAAEEATPCDDGLPCTSDDSCTNGQCFGASLCTPLPCESIVCETSDGCSVELTPGSCNIDGVCFSDGDKNPENVCQSCQPSVSTTAWTSANGICNDGDPCTTPDTCVDGVCTGTVKADFTACPVESTVANGICDAGQCNEVQENFTATSLDDGATVYRAAATASDKGQLWATYATPSTPCDGDCSFSVIADVFSSTGVLTHNIEVATTGAAPSAQHASGDFSAIDSLVFEVKGSTSMPFAAYPADGVEIGAVTHMRIATAASEQAMAPHLFAASSSAITTCVSASSDWSCQQDSGAPATANAGGFTDLGGRPYLFASTGSEVQLVGLVDDNAPLSWKVVATTASFGTVKTAVSNGTHAVAAGTSVMLVVADGSQPTPDVTQLILPGYASQVGQATLSFEASAVFNGRLVIGGTRTYNEFIFTRTLVLLHAQADASALTGDGWRETTLVASPSFLDTSCDSNCLKDRAIFGLAASSTTLLIVGSFRQTNNEPLMRGRWVLTF